MFISGLTASNETMWLTEKGYWVPDSRHAHNFGSPKAQHQMAEIRKRNSILDEADRIVPSYKDSR